MPWHRIRLGGGTFESAAEQQYFVSRISDWIEKRSAALSQLGVSVRTEQAEIHSEWDGDEKVWHLNDVALNVYREVGGSREVEDVVDQLPPGRLQGLLLKSAVSVGETWQSSGRDF